MFGVSESFTMKFYLVVILGTVEARLIWLNYPRRYLFVSSLLLHYPKLADPSSKDV